LPVRYLGLTAVFFLGLSVSGIWYSPNGRDTSWRPTNFLSSRISRLLTRPKWAANSWNWWRFQTSLGWSWHWAHWIWRPRKTRDVSAAVSVTASAPERDPRK